MPVNFQFRRGTTAELSTQTGLVGELFVDTTKDTVVVMDGTTAGGSPLATESMVAATEAALQAAIANVSGGSGGESNVYATVNTLKSQSLLPGTIAKTTGYHAVNDGGQATYFVMTPAQYGKTPDGWGDHEIYNGNIAVLVYTDRIYALQYGLVSDGITDNTDALIALGAAGVPVKFPANGAFKLVYSQNKVAEFTASVDFNNSRMIVTGENIQVAAIDPQYQVGDYAQYNYALYYSNSYFIKLTTPETWTNHGAGSALLNQIQTAPVITGKYVSSLLDQPDYANMVMIFETETPLYVYRTSVINRSEMVVHTRHGQLTNALEKDLETSQITNIKTMPLSESTTVYENFILDMTEAPTNMYDGYLAKYINIGDGSKIKIKNFHVKQNNDVRYEQFMGPVFFHLAYTALSEVDGLYATWPNQNAAPPGDPREGQSHYTYVINYGWSVDLMIKNVLCAGDGYGAFGGFPCWNATFENCVTNRIDFHEPMFGTTYVRNCTIGSHGIKTFNIGDLIIEKTKFIDNGGWVGGTRFLSSRPDHGGWCDGNLVVRDCEFYNTSQNRRYLVESDGLAAGSTYLSYLPETSPCIAFGWRTQTFENCTVHGGEVVFGQFAFANDWIVQSESIKATGLKVANGGKWVFQTNELPYDKYNAQFNTAYVDENEFAYSYDSASYWKKFNSSIPNYGVEKNFVHTITGMTDIITGDPVEPRFYNSKPNRNIVIRDSVVDEMYFWPEGNWVNVNVIIDNCVAQESASAVVMYPQLQGTYKISNSVINSIKLDTLSNQPYPVKLVIENNNFVTGGEPHFMRNGRSITGILNKYNGRGDDVIIKDNLFAITQDASNSWTWYPQEILKGKASGNWMSLNGAAPFNTFRYGSWGDGTSNIVPGGYNFDNTLMMAYTDLDGYEDPWNYASIYQELNFKLPSRTGNKAYAPLDSSNGVTLEKTDAGYNITMTDYTMNGGMRYKF